MFLLKVAHPIGLDTVEILQGWLVHNRVSVSTKGAGGWV